MKAIVISPNLDPNINISGISSVTKFIIENNKSYSYIPIEIGKRDNENRGFRWGYRLFKEYLYYFKLIVVDRIKIIHFNYPLNTFSIIRDTPIIFFTRLLDCKVIIHLHGGEFLMKEYLPTWVLYFLKNTFSGKETIIVLSEQEKLVITKKFQATNVKVLPNCVDLSDAHKFSKILNNNNSLRILFFGRITSSKGLNVIIDAFKLIYNQPIEVYFNCAGKGPEESTFIKEIKNLMNDNFSHLGVLTGNSKLEVLKNNDVFILPSLSGEGLPMALLEAMSFGLVPIVTDDGSMKYVVTDNVNGFIVNKSSPEEIVSKILELANNRNLLQELSQMAQEHIFKNYNPNLYINQLNKIYESE